MSLLCIGRASCLLTVTIKISYAIAYVRLNEFHLLIKLWKDAYTFINRNELIKKTTTHSHVNSHLFLVLIKDIPS